MEWNMRDIPDSLERTWVGRSDVVLTVGVGVEVHLTRGSEGEQAGRDCDEERRELHCWILGWL